MSDQIDVSAAMQLRDLQYAYASALDRRDPVALRAVFHPEATLRVFEPDADEPRSETSGHEQLVLMIDAMRKRYSKTMHVISNTAASIQPEVATGQAYCVAHHLIAEDRPRTFVAYLWYDDEFRRGPGGAWRIWRRDIRFLWAEERPALPWHVALTLAGLG